MPYIYIFLSLIILFICGFPGVNILNNKFNKNFSRERIIWMAFPLGMVKEGLPLFLVIDVFGY